MCFPETGDIIDHLIKEIDSIGNVTADNADKILELQKTYDSLPDNITKGYVTNYDILSEAVIEAKKIKANRETTDGKEKASDKDTGKNEFKVSFKPYVFSIKLSWTRVIEAKGYDVFCYNSRSGKYKKVVSLSAARKSYLVKRQNGSSGKKLKDGIKYKFKVSAYKVNDGKKKYIRTVKITTATCPKKVLSFSIKKKSKRKLILTWKRNPRCNGYEIWSKEGGKKYKRIRLLKKKTICKTAMNLLKEKQKYSFKIRSYITIGNKKIYSSFTKSETIVTK